MISILLADDHPVILRGLRDLFEAHEDMRVVGEESDGLKIVEAVERLKPAVLVLDLMMPGASGVEIIKQVVRQSPNTRIVVLSMHSNVAYVREALHAGAIGYVLKCVDAEELLHAVREAVAGRCYLSPPLSESEVEKYSRQVAGHGVDPHEMLTNRERQVLRLTAEGNTSTQISEQLHISSRTVESHRANLFRKLGFRNHTDLIRYAIKRGLVSPH